MKMTNADIALMIVIFVFVVYVLAKIIGFDSATKYKR
jgi:hypothetical protein